MLKIVLHLDDEQKWPKIKSNVEHILTAAPDTDLIVEVNGPAIKGYLDTDNQQFIKKYPQVTFEICHNSMEKFNINAEQLIAEIKVVPAGLLAVAQHEQAGYQYIKI